MEGMIQFCCTNVFLVDSTLVWFVRKHNTWEILANSFDFTSFLKFLLIMQGDMGTSQGGFWRIRENGYTHEADEGLQTSTKLVVSYPFSVKHCFDGVYMRILQGITSTAMVGCASCLRACFLFHPPCRCHTSHYKSGKLEFPFVPNI